MTPTRIRKVHVIFKTHLDIGFTDYARNVFRNYVQTYIPAAIELAQRLRVEGGPERFLWTTGSWLIYEYLEQADAAGRRRMEAAIRAGDIAWHGLPFTSHTELLDPALLRSGLSLAQTLDRRFGRTTIAAKMTDVPGHTLGLVPFLAEAGIRFLHIGVNIVCRPPAVPPVFRWRHPSGAEVVVMYHTGYGGNMTVPGLDDAIAFAHTGDNHGPQSAAEIRTGYVRLREQFPGATVAASTLDAFAQALLPHTADLPVVTQEIGDSWIHGVGTDPWKVAAFRELARGRERWLAEGLIDPGSTALQNFHRSLLLVAEHTWGFNEERYLNDFVNYARPDFAAARQRDRVGPEAVPPALEYARPFRVAEPRYSTLESSWAEQRDYIYSAVNALAGTPAHGVAQAALAALTPRRGTPTGRPLDKPGAVQATRHFKVRFDPATGALAGLMETHTHRRWADARHRLGLFRYQTFSQADYDRYLKQYCINLKLWDNWKWAIPDLSKPGMADTGAESRWWLPVLTRATTIAADDGIRYRMELGMPDESVRRYGAPAEIELDYFFPHAAPRLELTLQWFGKAANRLPEACWLSFCCKIKNAGVWRLDKLGSHLSPLDVVRFGNRKLHAVNAGVCYADTDGSMTLRTLDAPLVAPGAPSLLDFNQRQPNVRQGMHVNLYNNIWGTNFPMWSGADGRFRFCLEWNKRTSGPQCGSGKSLNSVQRNAG